MTPDAPHPHGSAPPLASACPGECVAAQAGASKTLRDMLKMAAEESRAARRAWSVGDSFADDNPDVKPAPVIERIKPFIGSGMTQQELADYLGVTRGPIVKALKTLGAKL